jgi:hypothetical protein
MDDSHIPKKVMEKCSGGKSPMGRSRSKCEANISKYAVDLLQIRKWKTVARKRESRRTEIRKAAVQNTTVSATPSYINE